MTDSTLITLPAGLSTVLTQQVAWQHFEAIDSTNTYLLGNDQPVNQLISTERQYQGRGRHGQQWIDEGESALFSLATGFTNDKPQVKDISAWPVQVALTLANTLNDLLVHFSPNSPRHETAIAQVNIKWPNDLYLIHNDASGKCAGILIETSMGKTIKVVTGVGINLAPVTQTVTQEYALGFISLPLNKKSLIPLLSNALFDAWTRFITNPQVDSTAYQSVDYLLGHDIIATDLHSGIQQRGIGAGINHNGHLLLQQDDSILTLTSQQRIRRVND